MKTARLFKHPEADPDENLWLRPTIYVYGRGHACQIYRKSNPDDDGEVIWWWDYDGRVDMKDDVQWHDLNGLESIEVPAEQVEVRHGDPTSVWLYIENGGDGSVIPKFFLTPEAAVLALADDEAPFCESDPMEVQTYEGSNVWWQAVERSLELSEENLP